MKPKHYAGIGQRDAPTPMLELAERIAERLAFEGWTLRSGHAEGMDRAFEDGAGDDAELYLPWSSFGGDLLQARTIIDRPLPEAFPIAAAVHPAWPACSAAARRLHARNAHIVLGPDLATFSRFVVCWHVREGGTACAARIARAHGVPVFNFAERPMFERLADFAAAFTS